MHACAIARLLPELRSRADDCCELCGAPIDFDAPPRTRRVPSVDHVVPRHLGGAELPPLDELRLAHVSCNSRRGVRTRRLAPRLPVRLAVEPLPDIEPRARVASSESWAERGPPDSAIGA
jgi:5-methylcytosine-specific restriction endonuclease McrA